MNLGIVFETEVFRIGFRRCDVLRASTFQLPTETLGDNKHRSMTRYDVKVPEHGIFACISDTQEMIVCNQCISRWRYFRPCIKNIRHSSYELHEKGSPGAIQEFDQRIVGHNLFETIFQ